VAPQVQRSRLALVTEYAAVEVDVAPPSDKDNNKDYNALVGLRGCAGLGLGAVVVVAVPLH
jgi:hypothetical protein